MKRATSLIFLLVLCLSLCACGQSEAAKAVDEQIAAIGEVTLESDALISAAEQAVSALEEKDQKQLKNVADLENARSTYDTLVFEANVAEVEEAIVGIGTVTLESGDVIAAARDAFEKSGADVQAKVSNVSVLEAAEAQLDDLRIAQVVELIDAIGEVTENSGDAIQAAQNGYDSLSKENAAKVSNAEVLTDAQSAFQSIKMQQAQALLSKFRLEDDPVRGMKFYNSKTQPYYADVRSYVFPYIGMNSNNEIWLCADFHYTGDDWVFFKQIIFSVDGKNTTKTFSYFNDIVRDNGGGDVWEYVNTGDGGQYEDLFWSIVNSTNTIVRFQGDNYHYDLTVSQKDKDAIREVLTAFDDLRSAGYTEK